MIANIYDLMYFGHVFDMFILALYIAAICRNLLSLSPFHGLSGRFQLNSLFFGPNFSVLRCPTVRWCLFASRYIVKLRSTRPFGRRRSSKAI